MHLASTSKGESEKEMRNNIPFSPLRVILVLCREDVKKNEQLPPPFSRSPSFFPLLLWLPQGRGGGRKTHKCPQSEVTVTNGHTGRHTRYKSTGIFFSFKLFVGVLFVSFHFRVSSFGPKPARYQLGCVE